MNYDVLNKNGVYLSGSEKEMIELVRGIIKRRISALWNITGSHEFSAKRREAFLEDSHAALGGVVNMCNLADKQLNLKTVTGLEWEEKADTMFNEIEKLQSQLVTRDNEIAQMKTVIDELRTAHTYEVNRADEATKKLAETRHNLNGYITDSVEMLELRISDTEGEPMQGELHLHSNALYLQGNLPTESLTYNSARERVLAYQGITNEDETTVNESDNTGDV